MLFMTAKVWQWWTNFINNLDTTCDRILLGNNSCTCSELECSPAKRFLERKYKYMWKACKSITLLIKDLNNRNNNKLVHQSQYAGSKRLNKSFKSLFDKQVLDSSVYMYMYVYTNTQYIFLKYSKIWSTYNWVKGDNSFKSWEKG